MLGMRSQSIQRWTEPDSLDWSVLRTVWEWSEVEGMAGMYGENRLGASSDKAKTHVAGLGIWLPFAEANFRL